MAYNNSMFNVFKQLYGGDKAIMQDHKARVRSMMQGFGQDTPTQLTVPDIKIRARMCRLLLEEVGEFIEACGFECGLKFQEGIMDSGAWEIEKAPDFFEMVDAMIDISVVLHGATNGCGIADNTWSLLTEEVDRNNLLKIQNGHLDPETGKFIKPKNHPKPNLVDILYSQDRDIIWG